MKTSTAVLTRVIMALFLVLSASAGPRLARAADLEEFKIGVTVPLSGPLAFVGEDIRRGFELGQSDFSGGRLRFNIIYEDNQYQARQAVSAARKLLELDRVDLIISLWDMAEVVAPLAESRKTPHISIRWNPHVAERFSYTLTMESTYQSWINSLLSLLAALRISNVALLTEEAQGWILGSDYFKKQIRSGDAQGIALTGEEQLPSDVPDHRTAVARLLAKKPEVVVLMSNPPFTERLIQWVRESNPRQRFTGYLDLVKDTRLTEGLPFVAQFDTAQWFRDKFQQRFGAPFAARAPHAYDILKLISLIQNQAGHMVGGAELVDALTKVRNVSGATGTLNGSPRRTIESECVWKIVERGSFRRLTNEDIERLHAAWPTS